MILVNLPSDQKFVQVVQFLYASAILLSTPLQLFPAVRIMENLFFKKTASGKMSPKVKWEKNFFRACTVFACYCIAWLGAGDLDKFVSFIGSFAWYVHSALLCHIIRTCHFDSFGAFCHFYIQHSAVLCLSCYAPLQGLRSHTLGES